MRGETVIVENEARPVVLGHPNYLGVFEPRHHGPTVLLAGTVERPAVSRAFRVRHCHGTHRR